MFEPQEILPLHAANQAVQGGALDRGAIEFFFNHQVLISNNVSLF
jgi:hypothetical protein